MDEEQGRPRAPLSGLVALVLAALVVAALVRFPGLDRVPPALFIDETSVGCEAYSIALTGHDLHGKTLPAIFRALDDWKHPLYIYAATLTTGAMGLDPITVRLPAAIFGTATVLLLALLARELDPDAPLAAPFAALALALMPWHVVYSRVAFEAVTYVFALVLSAWTFQRALRLGGASRYALAGAAAGLVAYSYTPAKLMAPLVLVVFVAIAWRARRGAERAALLRDLSVFAVCGVAVAVPIGLSVLASFDEANARFRGMSFLQEERPLLAFLRSYAAHLSPVFLFFRGDANVRHCVPGFGQCLLVTAPLAAAGLARTAARREPRDLVLLAWLVLYPLGGAVTTSGVPHASRAILAAPLVALLAARGASWLASRTRRPRLALALAGALLVAEGGVFLRAYALDYPTRSKRAWTAGRRELIELAERALVPRGGVARVLVLPLTCVREDVLFYTGFDPSEARRADPRWVWLPSGSKLEETLAAATPDTLVFGWEEPPPAPRPAFVYAFPDGPPGLGLWRGQRLR